MLKILVGLIVSFVLVSCGGEDIYTNSDNAETEYYINGERVDEETYENYTLDNDNSNNTPTTSYYINGEKVDEETYQNYILNNNYDSSYTPTTEDNTLDNSSYTAIKGDEDMCNKLFTYTTTSPEVDLSSPKTKAIHDILLATDPNNGYQLFMRQHKDFMDWINLYDTPLSTAIHETNHGIDSILDMCSPSMKSKYFSLGDIYTTDLNGDTAHYSIVEETIPYKLKSTLRYDIYIEGHKDANGNIFNILLDELNAYTGDAWFQVRFRESGMIKDTQYYNAYGNFGIDGVIDFIIYLEYYLKSARLYYPETYNIIKQQPETLAYIQYILQKAEEVIEVSFPYIIENIDGGSERVFFHSYYGEGTSGKDRLKQAYSSDALMELDNLGISHVDYSYWESTYFSYEYNEGSYTKPTFIKPRRDRVYIKPMKIRSK